jgi:hypothetical protein
MNTVTVDSSLQQSLAGLPGLTEVRDSAGVVIGYFSPASKQSSEVYSQAAAHFDPKEMERRKTSNQRGSSTSEVLNRIASQG